MTQLMDRGIEGQSQRIPVSIAVVVPLYNKRPHIADTIDSILAQSVLPAEIIVVDDGSTDGSAEIVSLYKQYNVRLISQENVGVSAARNRGVELATSVWIAFLDADDLWLPNHIEALLRVVQAFPDVGLVSTQYEILQDGIRLSPRYAYSRGAVCKVDDFYRRLAIGHSLVNSSTACARRDALISVGGFPVGIQIGEDIIVWIKLFEQLGMAHIGEVSSVLLRDAVNRSTSVTSVMPGSLTFLGQMLVQGGAVHRARQKSMAFLFDRMACVTAAGRQLQGDMATVRKIRLACWQYNRVMAWLAISFLGIIPMWGLRLARRWRHATSGAGCAARSQSGS
jgi:hypothetical protein